MPTSFLETVFGRKKPTVAAADAKLAAIEADLAAAPARIAAAEAVLLRVGDLSDEEHAAAETELAAARRSAKRLEAQAIDLRAARAEAAMNETAAALRARAAAVQNRAATMPGLMDRYDAAIGKIEELVDQMRQLDADVAAVNVAIDEANRDGLEAPERVLMTAAFFYIKPASISFDRVVTEEFWEVPDDRGRWKRASQLVERDGELVPIEGGGRKNTTSRTIPGKYRPGTREIGPLSGLCLLKSPQFCRSRGSEGSR